MPQITLELDTLLLSKIERAALRRDITVNQYIKDMLYHSVPVKSNKLNIHATVNMGLFNDFRECARSQGCGVNSLLKILIIEEVAHFKNEEFEHFKNEEEEGV